MPAYSKFREAKRDDSSPLRIAPASTTESALLVRFIAVQAVLVVAAVSIVSNRGHSSEDIWRDASLSPAVRADAAVRAMTLDEEIAIVHTHVGTPANGKPKPADAIGSAAVWSGVPRLGIPVEQESDGSLGVGNPLRLPFLYDVTALPSGIAIAATFDPKLARQGGAMIGAEARAHAFGVLLAGGANLIRDPRDGRAFEYASEDPLLTGRSVGAMIAGVQSAGVVSTLKHFAINDEETGRVVLSSDLRENAARESDLLAFEIALEQGHPAAVMTSYNRVDGTYTSENAALLATLKGDWRFPGFVMSDWGGTHSTRAAAVAGLDQQSGEEYDHVAYFGDALKAAIMAKQVPRERLDDMARRVLTAVFTIGGDDRQTGPSGAIDLDADGDVARRIATAGIVLLKNQGNVLPLRSGLRRIVVIGAHADRGVLSGGGSSQVMPRGSEPFSEEQPKHAILGIKYYHPSVPTDAIRQRAGGGEVVFVDGHDHRAAAEAARGADQVIVFAEQWLAESRDAPDLSLPSQQNDLIEAVAAANPRTVVVLETGSAVTMPWLDRVAAVLEAWYPGARGGDAIADILFGIADPSGRLPISFPQSEAQLPRPRLPDLGAAAAQPGGPDRGGFDIDYDTEGADVGYRWYARTGQRPLFPFGFGLSYTTFSTANLRAQADGDAVTCSVDVRNDGERAGATTVQLYAEPATDSFPRRLVGWSRVALGRSETKRVTMAIDPRLLARFDAVGRAWVIAGGSYTLSIGSDAATMRQQATVTLPAETFSAKHVHP